MREMFQFRATILPDAGDLCYNGGDFADRIHVVRPYLVRTKYGHSKLHEVRGGIVR